mgnify:CR=1 FL=1
MIILSRARSRLSAIALAGVVALTIAAPAQAAGSSMPWEAPLQAILESIQGPVAKIVAVIIIIATGLALAFAVPVHRALTEHILLGGAPRGLAIANATLAGAIGLGLQLWIAGIAFLALGHMAAMWAARRDPQFVDVARRHLRFPAHLQV